jgi:hypothetical protein
MNTDNVRLILTKGLIMKKVCATMVLKDLNNEQEGEKSAQTFQQDCSWDTALQMHLMV